MSQEEIIQQLQKEMAQLRQEKAQALAENRQVTYEVVSEGGQHPRITGFDGPRRVASSSKEEVRYIS